MLYYVHLRYLMYNSFNKPSMEISSNTLVASPQKIGLLERPLKQSSIFTPNKEITPSSSLPIFPEDPHLDRVIIPPPDDPGFPDPSFLHHATAGRQTDHPLVSGPGGDSQTNRIHVTEEIIDPHVTDKKAKIDRNFPESSPAFFRVNPKFNLNRGSLKGS